MYESSLNLLRIKGIKFERGLTLEEVKQIEGIYKISFPSSLKEFLMTALPISEGFYNWRNIQDDNVQFIKMVLDRPISDIYDMAGEVYWCDDWGEEPEDEKVFQEEVRKRLKEAPKLLPIYTHRYMPMVLEENPPVISIHDTDVVYYGENLKDYFKAEFGMKIRDIKLQNITPIPFWSDIM